MAETMALNDEYEAGTFVLDLKSGRLSHRFNLYCCGKDAISTYTIMFALSVGKTIYSENFDTLFGKKSEAWRLCQRDPMIL